MSTKKDCAKAIVEASKTGHITTAQANRILKRVAQLTGVRATKLLGSQDRALKQISGEILSRVRTIQKLQKRNALLTIKAVREWTRDAKNFPNLVEGLLARLEGGPKAIYRQGYSHDATRQALFKKYLGRLHGEFVRAGIWEDVRTGRIKPENIFEEMENIGYGRSTGTTGDDAAVKAATIIDGIYEDLRGQANLHGAWINREPAYFGTQRTDYHRLRKMFGKNMDQAFQGYYNYVIGKLDHTKTFGGADPVPFLRNVFDNFWTNNHTYPDMETAVTEFRAIGSVAKKQSESRVLHFKDAKSAFEYQRDLGPFRFFENLVMDLNYRTRAISLMMFFGPDPQKTFNMVKANLVEHAKKVLKSDKQVQALDGKKVQAAWDWAMGRLENPASRTQAAIVNVFLRLKSLASLGGVTLSSITDVGFVSRELNDWGVKFGDRLMSNVYAFSRKSPAFKEVLRQVGVGLDATIGALAHRFDLSLEPGGALNTVTRMFFKLNLLEYWTRSMQEGLATVLSHHLGVHSHLDFASLPEDISRNLTHFGVTSRDWDFFRQSAWDFSEIGKLITPDQFFSHGNMRITLDDMVRGQGLKVTSANLAREKARLEALWRQMMEGSINRGVIKPGAAEYRITTWGQQAGTLGGSVARIVMYLTSFPIAVVNKALLREIHGRGRFDTSAMLSLTRFIAYTTILGWMSNSIRDILKGREPRPFMPDGKFGQQSIKVLLDSAMRGGGLGWWGDLLFSEYERTGRTLTSKLAGPLGGDLDLLAEVFSGAIRSENVGTPAYRLMRQNAPFMNLFYIKPVVDYLVWNNLQEAMDPGSLQRLERRMEREYHQSYFLSPDKQRLK